MIEYLVVVLLTFMDGSYVEYNDGKWETAVGEKECQDKIKIATTELKEFYKDQKDPKPSTFIQGCVSKGQ